VDVEQASDVSGTEYKLVDRYGQIAFTSNGLRDGGPIKLSVDGPYTLLVEGSRANAGFDTYTLNVHSLGAAPVQSLSLGVLTTGSIETPGDTAEYSFNLSDRSLLHFDSLTNSSNLYWTLAGPAGTSVSSRRFDRSDASINNPTLDLPAGEYRLSIDAGGACRSMRGETKLVRLPFSCWISRMPN
jgi:hypothetical protein